MREIKASLSVDRLRKMKGGLALRLPPHSKIYGTSIISSRPKVKLGRLRPFMYLAAVCDSAVTRIGSAMVESQGTYAVCAPRASLPYIKPSSNETAVDRPPGWGVSVEI